MRRADRARSIVLVAAVALLVGCSGKAGRGGSDADAASAERGRQAIERYGCGACHAVPGVEGAGARVGPSLADLAGRPQLTGGLANTPDNLVRWVQHPQEVKPDTSMPDLGIGERDARDIASYLLRRTR